jgi:hypothetical protein
MIVGDIVTVHHQITGQECEAVVKWFFPGNTVARCEWISGPDDGESVYVRFDEEE